MGEEVLPRYYPLRFPRHFLDPALNPELDDPSWRIPGLEGIWLGSYSAHGTEVLFLDLDVETNHIIAWKITGDENVPRGVPSWWFEAEGYSPSEESPVITPEDIQLGFGDIPRDAKIFRGFANISGQGYSPDVRESCPMVVAILGKNDIKVWWEVLDCTSNITSYVGRNVETEIVSLGGALRKEACASAQKE